MTLIVRKSFEVPLAEHGSAEIVAEKHYDHTTIRELVADGHRWIGVAGHHFEPQPLDLSGLGMTIEGRPDDDGLPHLVVNGGDHNHDCVRAIGPKFLEISNLLIRSKVPRLRGLFVQRGWDGASVGTVRLTGVQTEGPYAGAAVEMHSVEGAVADGCWFKNQSDIGRCLRVARVPDAALRQKVPSERHKLFTATNALECRNTSFGLYGAFAHSTVIEIGHDVKFVRFCGGSMSAKGAGSILRIPEGAQVRGVELRGTEWEKGPRVGVLIDGELVEGVIDGGLIDAEFAAVLVSDGALFRGRIESFDTGAMFKVVRHKGGRIERPDMAETVINR